MSQRRAGMTLVEVLIAITVLAVVLVAGMTYMSTQTQVFAASVERSTALTRGRFVVQTVQRDLRTLAAHLTPGQPGLVVAGSDVVSFHADYASNVVGDPFATFVDVDAPDGEVSAPTSSFTVPGTSVIWGNTVYRTTAGSVSPAEHLTLFFRPDSSTTATDDFVLYRQINDAAPEIVSDGVRRLSGAPFFEYWTAAPEAAAGGSFSALPDSVLPLVHDEPFHLSPADTAMSALVDSVRAVAVRFAVWPQADTSVVRPLTVNRMIALPNAGVEPIRSCGSDPILGDTLVLSATASTSGGNPVVDVSWPSAIDDGGGESDVIRYVLWRRVLPDTAWGDPMLSLPAGVSSYTYTDAAVESGETYDYALAAQDCTPSLSDLRLSGVVIVP